MHKLDRDAEEWADEREQRKTLVLEVELEEKQTGKEAIMFNYLQHLQYMNAGVHNPSLHGSSTWPMNMFLILMI